MRRLLLASIFLLAFGVSVFPQTNQSSTCPTIVVFGQSGVPSPNEPIKFSTKVDTNGQDLKLEYVWFVSNGKILEGQGTSSIKIEFPFKNNSNVTVTIEVKGFPIGCPNTASESMIWDPAPEAVKIAEFLSPISKIKGAEVEKIIKTIQDDPNARLYVIVGYKKKLSEKKLTDKERELSKLFVKKHGIDAGRIVMTRVVSDKELMQFWIVPSGALPPGLKNN